MELLKSSRFAPLGQFCSTRYRQKRKIKSDTSKCIQKGEKNLPERFLAVVHSELSEAACPSCCFHLKSRKRPEGKAAFSSGRRKSSKITLTLARAEGDVCVRMSMYQLHLCRMVQNVRIQIMHINAPTRGPAQWSTSLTCTKTK